MNFWKTTILGNTLAQWTLALAVGLIVLGLLRLVTWLLRLRLKKYDDQPIPNPSVLIRSILRHTFGFFYVWIAIYAALQTLSLNEAFKTIINLLTIIVILIQAGFWAIEIIEYVVARRQIGKDGDENYRKGAITAILLIARIIVWTVVGLMILDNIPGVNLTALLASLGIGGLAVGLALNRVFGDLFASLTISIDQPFVEGDSISVGEFSGVVEHVGLKSTRVRSITGEELIFSNSDLTDSRIRNYKRMKKRLVILTLDVTYETSYKKLQKIPKIIKEAIETHKQVTFNRAHFKAYGPSSLIYEIAYTINSADFSLYMDAQQAINLEIFKRFQDEGIEFAYPTQTVVLSK
jgi:small-conductance mechanosensitive channel